MGISKTSSSLGRGFLWFGLAVVVLSAYLAYAWRSLPDVTPLQRQNPTETALMRQRAEEAVGEHRRARRRQSWIGLSSIAPMAVWAVLLSEDAGFFVHGSIDPHELANAAQDAWEKKQLGRGASTITQQLAKNLYLSTDRSLLRKLKELIIAQQLEEALTKKRILTLYLNVVEWGDGVYGIEAAAEEHFGVSAAELSPAQAVVLASMLPSPRRWTPRSKSSALRKRSLRLVDHLTYVGKLTPEQARETLEEVEAILGDGPSPMPTTEEELESEIEI